MNSLNIGILAHIDAGKTSLTERILFNKNIIKTLGSVDKGNTQTDTLELEKQRGITIRSAVVSFDTQNLKINLIDTPGHPDFIAEVERGLNILDAAVLVISAVEGIQPQTQVFAKILKKLQIPTLIFINKIDRTGARTKELIKDIETRLFDNLICLNEVADLGSSDVRTFTKKLNSINELDLVNQINTGQLQPVIFGSAIKNLGISDFLSTLENYFQPQITGNINLLSALIFKIEFDSRGQKVAYLRIYSGRLQARSSVKICRNSFNTNIILETKIKEIHLLKNGTTKKTETAFAGDIVKVFGINNIQIGDWVGEETAKKIVHFSPPSLEVVISPKEKLNKAKLYQALTRISEQDPLIYVTQNIQGEISVKLYGQVQQEVIESTLQNEYNIEVNFAKTQVIYVEKVLGTGKAYAEKFAPDNLFIATLGICIKPGNPGSGVVFKIGTGRGSLPIAFQKSIEESVHKTLRQGLCGWQIIDSLVEVTDVGYDSFASSGGDFRGLTPLLVMEALQKAKTDILEPTNNFELNIPEKNLTAVLQTLSKSEAKIEQITEAANQTTNINGIIPVAKIFDFEKSLPDLTGGQALFTTQFAGYNKVSGKSPTQPRTDFNPLNKKEYLGHVLRRE